MLKTLNNYEEKPYNKCIDCMHIGKNCDGPNFLAMEMSRLSEWCKLRKVYLHSQNAKWTNAYIAEQSGVSTVSVDRFIAGHVEDIKMSTVARIIKVLVNGTWGQYPCAMAAESESVYVDNPALVERAENAIAQCRKLQDTLDGIREEHKENLAAVRADDKAKIDYLKEQIKFKESQMATKDNLVIEYNEHIKRKNRVILWLAILLGVAVCIILTFLVVDALNPDRGFFWLADFFGNATNGFLGDAI